MYLYILGFSKHPSLLKVGVSKSPLDRIRTLEKWHGECVSSVFYNMGKTYHRAEKLIHVLLEDSNVRVDGDGGTEFFNADVVFGMVEKVVELCGGNKEEIIKEDRIELTPLNKEVDSNGMNEIKFDNGDFVEYHSNICTMFDLICCGNFTIEDTNDRVVIHTDVSMDIGAFSKTTRVCVRSDDFLIGFDPLRVALNMKAGSSYFSFLSFKEAKDVFFDPVSRICDDSICDKEVKLVVDCIQAFYYLCSQYTGKFYEDNVKYIEGRVV